jgi:hypothetical protein
MRRAAQALAILLITFALAEVVLRVYDHFYPSFIFYNSSNDRFRGKPNAPDYDFHLNSKGFKDVEFKTQKEEGTYRILGLGDSFAFGVVSYKYNYLTLLEENLNHGGRKTELINMGIVATGPKDYLVLLAKEGLELKPDLVLVSFFIGNDFMQDGGVRRLYTYSYVASFIAYLIAARGYQGQIIHGAAVYNDSAPTLTDPVFVDMENQRSEIYRKQNRRFGNDFEAALGYLVKIKQLCDQHHIALAMVLIPDDVQVDQMLQARVVKLKQANSQVDDFDFRLPNRLLAARLKQQNIECLDLLDEFTRAGNGTVLYKPNDSHWNIAGNRLAADAIARDLFHVASRPGAQN